MKKLLVMVPTRGRPKRLEEMLESYYKTKSEDTQIVVYASEDDPYLSEYKKQNVVISTGPRMYLVEAYNYLWEPFKDEFEYFAPLNDDHVFLTPDWDKKLIDLVETEGKGWGLACAEDNLTNWAQFQHPSGLVISGNIPRTLGYFIWPKFQHIGVDGFYKHLMQGVDRLYRTTDVVIEHRHWINGKALLDANYKFVYSAEQFQYGMKTLDEYINTQLQTDIAKLKKAIGA